MGIFLKFQTFPCLTSLLSTACRIWWPHFHPTSLLCQQRPRSVLPANPPKRWPMPNNVSISIHGSFMILHSPCILSHFKLQFYFHLPAVSLCSRTTVRGETSRLFSADGAADFSVGYNASVPIQPCTFSSYWTGDERLGLWARSGDDLGLIWTGVASSCV